MASKRLRSKEGSRKYHIELTPLSTFLWGGCLFFVLAWIFVLGILVGRGFLPGAVSALSDLKDQIGVLQQMVKREKSLEAEPPKKSDSDPELAFYEKLASKKEETQKDWVPQRNAKKNSDKKPHPPQAFSSGAESLGAQKGTAQNQEGTSKMAQPERKERAKPSTPEAKYTVQLSSLEDKDRADKMIRDLGERGYPAYYYEANVKGKIYYRVRCGKFPTRKEAEDYARKLRKEAGMKGFVSRIE